MSTEREKQVLAQAAACLVGRRIVSVTYLSDEDANSMGWGHKAPVIILDDGTSILAMADDEGNDGGVLDIARGEEPLCFLGSFSAR